MTAGGPSIQDDPQWWRQAVVYQIYPRSFADANGDGVGDLPGILARVGHLRELGVDAVWLSPFYPSALADGGYDVDDYRDVDPRLGTLADADALFSALHANGIRVIVDLVPNHTSNRHAWFRAAIAAGRDSPERARYIFRDGRGAAGELPPNDWPSHFGASAWSRIVEPDGVLGQWYLHLFAPEQPDLNWDHPDVHADFENTIRFWADRGVDGFRVDVAHALKKDLSEPYRDEVTIGVMDEYPLDGSHPLIDRDDVHEIYRSWRKVFDEYSPPRVAVAEATVPAPRRALYATEEELGQAFNFDLLEAPWDARRFRSIIQENLSISADTGSSSTWTLSNHDVVRHATRYGLPRGTDLDAWLLTDGATPPLDRERGLRRARAAVLLLLALPGSTYLYQGEELGLHEVADLPREVLQDPIWKRDGGSRKGRDGCRVPLPWAPDGPSFGFGAKAPHLPQPSWFGSVAVEGQRGDASSTLQLYRAAIRERRALLAPERLDWLPGDDSVLAFERPGGWMSVTNFGQEPIALPPGRLVLSSVDLEGELLPGDATAWLVREQG